MEGTFWTTVYSLSRSTVLATTLPFSYVSTLNDNVTTSPAEELNFDITISTTAGIRPKDDVFLSQEAVERFHFISKFILIPIICTFGLISNSMGIGALWQDTKQQKMSIYVYLCALTLADILYIALGLLRSTLEILMSFGIEMAKYIDAQGKPAVIYLDMVFSHTASAMIIVMSFERLLALVKPLTVKYTWFGKYPARIVLFCVLFNLLFLMAYPINFEVISFVSDNKTEYSLRFKEGASESMRKFMLVQRIVDNFIPVIILIGTNVAIPIKYYRIIKRRQITLSMVPGLYSTSQQIKITMTVFAVTLMYMFLQVPVLISLILPYVDCRYSFDGERKSVFWFFIDLGNLFAYINAANDFLIYIVVSRHYRSVFKSKYCACFSRRQLHMKETDISATAQSGSSICTMSTIQEMQAHL